MAPPKAAIRVRPKLIDLREWVRGRRGAARADRRPRAWWRLAWSGSSDGWPVGKPFKSGFYQDGEARFWRFHRASRAQCGSAAFGPAKGERRGRGGSVLDPAARAWRLGRRPGARGASM